MISFTKYVLFPYLFINIIFGTKANFVLIRMIVAISFTSSGDMLGLLLKYFCLFSIDTNSNWHTGKTKEEEEKVSFLKTFFPQD